MKRINIIFALLAFSFITCDDDFLNEPPLDRITENDVWNDKALMDTYLFKIYDRMPWDYLESFWDVGGSQRDAISDLARGTYAWTGLHNQYCKLRSIRYTPFRASNQKWFLQGVCSPYNKL